MLKKAIVFSQKFKNTGRFYASGVCKSFGALL